MHDDTPKATPEHDGNPFRSEIEGGVRLDSPLAAEAAAESPPVQICIRQFGIIHLFAWITVTAVLLKCSQAALLLGGQTSGRYKECTWLLLGLYLILYSAGLVGFFILNRVHCWRYAKRLQPGHWLLLLHVLAGAFYIIPFYVSWVFRAVPILMPALLFLFLFSFLWFAAARRLHDSLIWNVLFVLIAVRHLLFFSLGFMEMSFLAESIACFVAIHTDYKLGKQRDWLHWIGVSMFCMEYMLWLYFLMFLA
jgi:hypothetical protein